jgi:hypothetical protein
VDGRPTARLAAQVWLLREGGTIGSPSLSVFGSIPGSAGATTPEGVRRQHDGLTAGSLGG